MLIEEIIRSEVDEGVKDWLGKAALATALTMTPSASAEPAPSPDQAENTLMKTAKASGIKGEELAAFMAQCAHETQNFTHLKEIGGLLDFRKYDPKYNKSKARVLGNTEKGDGAKYKGRGFIQLTGRDNYHRAGQALGLPLEAKPELVEKPSIAAKVAVWFWKNRVKPDVDDFNNVAAVTKKINPGLRGLENRKDLFNEYKEKILGFFKKTPKTQVDKPTTAKTVPSGTAKTDNKTADGFDSKSKIHTFDIKSKKWIK